VVIVRFNHGHEPRSRVTTKVLNTRSFSAVKDVGLQRRASQTRAREACAHFYRVSTNSNTRQQRRRDVICAKARARPERLVKPTSAPLAYAPLVGAVRLGHARRGARQPLVPKPLVPKTLVQKRPLCPRLLVPLTLHPKSGAEAVGLARFSDHCLNGTEQLQHDLIPSSACASDCGTVIPISCACKSDRRFPIGAKARWGQGLLGTRLVGAKARQRAWPTRGGHCACRSRVCVFPAQRRI